MAIMAESHSAISTYPRPANPGMPSIRRVNTEPVRPVGAQRTQWAHLLVARPPESVWHRHTLRTTHTYNYRGLEPAASQGSPPTLSHESFVRPLCLCLFVFPSPSFTHRSSFVTCLCQFHYLPKQLPLKVGHLTTLNGVPNRQQQERLLVARTPQYLAQEAHWVRCMRERRQPGYMQRSYKHPHRDPHRLPHIVMLHLAPRLRRVPPILFREDHDQVRRVVQEVFVPVGPQLRQRVLPLLREAALIVLLLLLLRRDADCVFYFRVADNYKAPRLLVRPRRRAIRHPDSVLDQLEWRCLGCEVTHAPP